MFYHFLPFVLLVQNSLSQSISLPPLIGPSLVGTVTLPLTLPYPDPLAPTSTPLNRTLMLSIFYPVQHVRKYPITSALDPAYASYLTTNLSLPQGLLQSINSQAHGGAYLHPQDHSPPPTVLLFSPGYGNSREDYTTTLSNLASLGSLVIGVDHPFDTAFISYPDGRVALSPYGEIGSIAEAEKFVDVRVKDLKGLLDALGANKTFTKQIPGVHGVLDVKSVGVFGHSLGGAAAASLMLSDTRASCGANLDGLLVGPVVTSGLPKGKDFLIVGAEGHNSSNDASWSSFLSATKGKKVELSIKGATHGSFSDFAYLYELGKKLGVIPDLGGIPFGSIDGERMLDLMGVWLGAWFDKCLRNEKEDGMFVGGSKVWPEVEVVTGWGK